MDAGATEVYTCDPTLSAASSVSGTEGSKASPGLNSPLTVDIARARDRLGARLLLGVGVGLGLDSEAGVWEGGATPGACVRLAVDDGSTMDGDAEALGDSGADEDGVEVVEEDEALGEVDLEGSDPEADREASGVVLGVVVALGEVVVDSGDDRVGLGEELEVSVWVLVTVPDPLSLKE